MYLSNNDTIKVIVEQLIKEDCIFEKSLIKEDMEDSLIEYISFYCTINSIPYIDIIPTRSNDLINDIAKVYLQEISKIPLLSSEEELSLTTSYIETRDKDIRDNIILFIFFFFLLFLVIFLSQLLINDNNLNNLKNEFCIKVHFFL